MNMKINYGTGVATLPTAALGSLDRATKADIKLLFLLCAEPNLLSGENSDECLGRISERVGISAAQVGASLAFWRGAGVLDIEDEGERAEPSVTASGAEDKPAADAETLSANNSPSAEVTPLPGTDAAPVGKVTVTRARTRMLDEIPNYTSDELERFLTEQKDAANYLDECQSIWGGIFNQRDTAMVISLVNTWGFSWDYVLTLLAYGNKYFKERDNQGKSLHFVYRLASNYHKEGILTDEALRQKFVEEEKLKDFEHRIRSMFGLGVRNLTPREKKYFSTWLYEYKYGPEVIEIAYNITVDTKGSPNMSYTNGILKNWYEEGLTTAEAISAKREQENTAVGAIREGRTPPDTLRETVERIRSAEGGQTAAESETTPAGDPRDTGILRRLLGLGNRMLTDGEIAAFTKWRVDFGFRYELIYYAYQITLENRREYSLPYMDAILSKWNARGLNTVEAVKTYEKGFREERERVKNKPKAPLNAPAENHSFDTGDFFLAAVKRSFGEDFDPSILNQ